MFLISCLTCAPHISCTWQKWIEISRWKFHKLVTSQLNYWTRKHPGLKGKSSTEKGLIYFIPQHFAKLDIFIMFITHNIAKTKVFFCTSCLYCHGGFVVKTHARPSPIIFTNKIGVWPLMVFAIIIKIILSIWGIMFISKVIIKTYQNWLFITN